MMNELVSDLSAVRAEAFLAAGICVLLLFDLFIRDRHRDLTYALAMLLLAGTGWLAATAGGDGRVLAFGGSVVVDPLARVLKVAAALAMAVVFLYSRPWLRERQLFRGEYYVLGLFALLGILVIISGHSFLVIYLGLEMLSLALYALVVYDRDSPIGAESGMKYFVLGAIASGTLLYGMSIVYGFSGTLNLGELREYAAGLDGVPVFLLVGLGFMLSGIAFKFGAVPFHMWVPDVYQGAPTSVSLLIATAPKLASIALVIRLVAEALPELLVTWQVILMTLAVLSLLIGNIVAIAQTNIKRMLAYSAIAHVGFILLGVATGTTAGVEAAVFYSIVYVVAAAGAFGIIMLLSSRGAEADQLDDFRGLSQRSPWFALMMLLLMASMIGIPPLAGFYAKWIVLLALVEAGAVWLALFAVLMSVVGAFYYLRVIRLMYFDELPGGAPVQAPGDFRLVLSINALLALALGLFPGPLMDLCTGLLG
ncbi:MAG: NADH-quinone oxidoreductase subunit NuoN [Chromatiales bacterium]|nr:NADH-quinone oxidoreductase subunit NuoN [Chromatiales bacterium]